MVQQIKLYVQGTLLQSHWKNLKEMLIRQGNFQSNKILIETTYRDIFPLHYISFMHMSLE